MMKQSSLSLDSYSQVVQDYFLELKRVLQSEQSGRLIIYAAIGAGCLGGVWAKGSSRNWIAAIPLLAAILSAAFHSTSLPFILHLIPASEKQRERYIQRMLYIKVLIPIAFALLCDAAALCLASLSLYAFLLQIISIAFITYLCGMLQEDGIKHSEQSASYQELKDFVILPPLLCYTDGILMLLICTDSISRTEFWIILTVMLLLLAPTTLFVQKHWNAIRHSLASYQRWQL